MASGGLRRRQNSEPSSAVVIDSPDHASSLLSQLSLLRMDRATSGRHGRGLPVLSAQFGLYHACKRVRCIHAAVCSNVGYVCDN